MLLKPYRVLDLTHRHGGLCGQILADLGADVIQVEPPGGAPGRHLGPFAGDQPDPAKSLYWQAYTRGKRGIELDIVADPETFHRLVLSADLLIESHTPAARARLGLDPATLSTLNPGLIHVSLTPYGSTGPKADWAASDLTLVANSGPMAMTGDEDRPPLRVSVPQAWHHAAAEGAVGALVALHERVASGRGQHVDVAAQQALTLATQGNILSAAVGETTAQRIAGGIKAGDIRIQLTYPAKDGFVSITHIFGATVGPATRRLMEYVYDEGFCDAATRDKDWIGYGLALATGQEPLHEFERVKACVAACTASKSKDELLNAAMERRLLLAPMSTIADVVESDQFGAREFFASLPAGGGLPQVKFPGAFAKFSQTPLAVSRPPPALGEHTAEVLADLAARTAPPKPQTSPKSDLPLAGVKVLDFMWALAGPGATRSLADWGATVIRVESSNRLDVCRTIRPFMSGDELPEKSAVFHSTNAGKKMLSLDLTKAESRQVILDLVAWADVVTESFSPRGMKAFGLEYDTLRQIKPDLIMLSTCLMGQTGPLAMFAGYGNLAAAIAGFYTITGWPDREPAGPFGAYTDYIAPRFNAAALLAALDHRRRTGEGQHIDLAQAEAASHFLTPAILDYQINGHCQTCIGNRDGNWAPHGVYPVRGDDRFIAIACETDEHWRSLRELLPALHEVDASATVMERMAQQDALDAAIAAFTRECDGESLENDLQSRGVPCARVLNSPELVADAQLAARHHFQTIPHPEGETTTIEGARFSLSRSQPARETSAPTFSRDMMYVFNEVLGYNDEQIGALLVAGVLE